MSGVLLLTAGGVVAEGLLKWATTAVWRVGGLDRLRSPAPRSAQFPLTSLFVPKMV